METEEPKVGVTLEKPGDQAQVIDFSKQKKKKKAKKRPTTDEAGESSEAGASAASGDAKEKVFDLNEVEGHTNYDYMFLLDRIEEIMNKKKEDIDESKRTKDEVMITTKIISTKTSWYGFEDLCKHLNRETKNVCDFYEAELGTKGNPGDAGNLILQGKF